MCIRLRKRNSVPSVVLFYCPGTGLKSLQCLPGAREPEGNSHSTADRRFAQSNDATKRFSASAFASVEINECAVIDSCRAQGRD